MTLTKPRLKLFLGHIPDTGLCVRAVIVDSVGPVILRLKRRQHITGPHRAVDPVRDILFGMHAAGKTVNKLGVRLEHQRDQGFLAFQRQRLFAAAIELVPGHVIARGQRIRSGDDPVKICAKPVDPCRLAFIGDMPVARVAGRAPRQLPEHPDLRWSGGGDRPYPGKGGFTRRDPAVDQPWVIDQERCHAKAGGIANAEPPPDIRIEGDGGCR